MKSAKTILLLTIGTCFLEARPCPAATASALASAIWRDDVATVQKILNDEPKSVNAPTGDQFHPTPVFIAVERGNTNIVDLLVKRGANLTVTTKWGHRTPIDEAVRMGKTQVISWWLSGSPSSNSVERAFELSIAPQDQESTVWRTILDDPRAVQLLRTSDRPYIPRSLQVRTTPNGPQLRKDRVAIVKGLLALGFNPDAELDGKTASDIAASNLDLDALRIVDTHNRYDSLLQRFIHQKGSVYVGRWSNGKDNFKQKVLVLTTNGQDTFQGSTETFPILWCLDRNTLQVHLPFAKANGAPDPMMSGTLSQDQSRIECRFPRADGTAETEVLTRSEEETGTR